MALKLCLAGAVCLLLLTACSAAPAKKIEQTVDVRPMERDTTLYVVPFQPVLAPESLASGVFDRFVDAMNDRMVETGIEASILKQPIAAVDPVWLDKQYYVVGDIFAYGQESGCCSTEMRVKGRMLVYQPQTRYPVAKIEIPYNILFDHDRSNLEDETARMIETLATQMNRELIAVVGPR